MVADGRQAGMRYGAVHWDIARMLLDAVTPDPSRDDLVRRWYRATAVFFMSRRLFSDAVPHLDRARRLFPADPAILVESGYLHEIFASPRIQDVIRRTTPPGGAVFAVASTRSNLRDAETYFRRAVELDEAFIEARLRLGHVVGLLGRHEEAVSQLQRTVAGTRDPLFLYHASMFLGNEERALGHRDLAREAYEKAAALYPRAQSPPLALTQLARGAGDRPGALRALQPLLALPADESAREDPWWGYYAGQGRDAAPLFAEVRARVSLTEPR
jgi:tetratricopeptide (TPR) repeat protein